MKQQKNFRLDDATLFYIQSYRIKNHLANDTAALTQIIEDHKHRNDVPATKILVESLAKQVAEELKDSLTRIRLGSNNADRNSEVILLLLNTLLSYSSYKSLIEKDTPQLVEAKQIIKDRIANYRQRKCNRPASTSHNGDNLVLDEDLLF